MSQHGEVVPQGASSPLPIADVLIALFVRTVQVFLTKHKKIRPGEIFLPLNIRTFVSSVFV